MLASSSWCSALETHAVVSERARLQLISGFECGYRTCQGLESFQAQKDFGYNIDLIKHTTSYSMTLVVWMVLAKKQHPLESHISGGNRWWNHLMKFAVCRVCREKNTRISNKRNNIQSNIVGCLQDKNLFVLHVINSIVFFSLSHVLCRSYCKERNSGESFVLLVRGNIWISRSYSPSCIKWKRLGSKNIMEYSRNRLNRASASMWRWKWPSCGEML